MDLFHRTGNFLKSESGQKSFAALFTTVSFLFPLPSIVCVCDLCVMCRSTQSINLTPDNTNSRCHTISPELQPHSSFTFKLKAQRHAAVLELHKNTKDPSSDHIAQVVHGGSDVKVLTQISLISSDKTVLAVLSIFLAAAARWEERNRSE